VMRRERGATAARARRGRDESEARAGASRDAARAEVDGFRRKSTMMPIRVDAGRQAKEAGQRAAPVFRPRFAWWRTGACSWGGRDDSGAAAPRTRARSRDCCAEGRPVVVRRGDGKGFRQGRIHSARRRHARTRPQKVESRAGSLDHSPPFPAPTHAHLETRARPCPCPCPSVRAPRRRRTARMRRAGGASWRRERAARRTVRDGRCERTARVGDARGGGQADGRDGG
jgi:hypothetical protein